jgi:hypothetical protein
MKVEKASITRWHVFVAAALSSALSILFEDPNHGNALAQQLLIRYVTGLLCCYLTVMTNRTTGVFKSSIAR